MPWARSRSASVLTLLLVAAACHELAAARTTPEEQEQQALGQPAAWVSPLRRLLTAAQGYTIGVPDNSRNFGVANQKFVQSTLLAAVNAALKEKGVDANTAQAGTIRGTEINTFATNFADNGYTGGASKQTVDYRAKTDQSNAVSSGASDSRSISQPGIGLTSSGALQYGVSLVQKLVDPGPKAGDGADSGADVGTATIGSNSTLGTMDSNGTAGSNGTDAVIKARRGNGKATLQQLKQAAADGSSGSTGDGSTYYYDDGRACPTCKRPPTGELGGEGDYYYSRPGPTYDILLSVNGQYGISGDYLYVGGGQDYNGDSSTSGGSARRSYDYDYGQLRPIPETALDTGRVRTVANDELGRTGSYGGVKSEATAPAALARHKDISGAVAGQATVLNQNDIYGTTSSIPGINPARKASATSAGFTAARNYKFSQPSSTISTGHTGTVASRGYPTGATADTLNYGSSTKSTTMRSQVISANGAEEVNTIAGRRRRRHML